MKNNGYALVLATFTVASALTALGCADDRPVYLDKTADNGIGGSGGTSSGTGGTGNTGNTGNTGGTGGSTSNDNLPGADRPNVWQVFSFDINEADAYDTMDYYRDKGNGLINCAESTSCMTEALNDTPGRKFQFLKDGDYSETFQGLLKGFCVYRTGSCDGQISVEAGYNCEDSDGDSRTCLVAGVLQLSDVDNGSPTAEIPATHTINIGFDSGDECKPVVLCFGSEHAVTFLD
jgi:hypothetical protein